MKTPESIFGQLFIDLQLAKVNSDPKAISDAIPLMDPSEILKIYESEKVKADFDINHFFNSHFKVQKLTDSSFKTNPNNSPKEHIESLWELLTRNPDIKIKGDSKIALPHSYIVPGGRFNEIYYWDSYFTMLGLFVSKKHDLIRSMIKNFAYLIDRFGHIPNGNRSYFISRSQPPFFSLMIELLSKIDGEGVILEYIDSLEKEYTFWMNGSEELNERHTAKKHCVLLKDNIILNRYYDNDFSPRAEMYSTDLELCNDSNCNDKELYKHLRAACESGWDFSSRWLEDPQKLESIQTGNIIPVDLNCLLYNLEKLLAKAHTKDNNLIKAKRFNETATIRKNAIETYLWNEELGFYCDYNFSKKENTNSIYASGAFPLFLKITSKNQAKRTCDNIMNNLVAQWGILTSTIHSGQQWDAPNGWAPLQWITYAGMKKYDFIKEAEVIRNRWILLNERVFKKTGKFLEKYNVNSIEEAIGGGEYPVQDGFGWTNGVYLAMKDQLNIE